MWRYIGLERVTLGRIFVSHGVALGRPVPDVRRSIMKQTSSNYQSILLETLSFYSIDTLDTRGPYIVIRSFNMVSHLATPLFFQSDPIPYYTSSCFLVSSPSTFFSTSRRRQKTRIQHRLYQPIHHHITNSDAWPVVHEPLPQRLLHPLPTPLHSPINLRSLPLRTRREGRL